MTNKYKVGELVRIKKLKYTSKVDEKANSYLEAYIGKIGKIIRNKNYEDGTYSIGIIKEKAVGPALDRIEFYEDEIEKLAGKILIKEDA